jgi:HTH-like domain
MSRTRSFQQGLPARLTPWSALGLFGFRKPVSDRAIEDQRLLGKIRESYVAGGGVYGSLRVCGDLREAGEGCSKHRVAKIMRTHKIKALRGYKAPRRVVGRPSIIAPNRLQLINCNDSGPGSLRSAIAGAPTGETVDASRV